MKLSVAILVCSFLATIAAGAEFSTGLKILTPEETSAKLAETQRSSATHQLARDLKDLPPDNGGNWGDLIYRGRETGDSLVLREVLVLNEVPSDEIDAQWYASVNVKTVTNVRVLNIGRERAYALSIDVQKNEVQALLRIAGYNDPRVLVEVYGY